MSILLHAASPASALLLSAALNSGRLDPDKRRVLVLDSSTPAGAALERGWSQGLWAELAHARVDLAFSSPRAAMPDDTWPAAGAPSGASVVGNATAPVPGAGRTPSLLVLDPSQPAAASALAAAWPKAAVVVFGDGLSVLCPTPSGLDKEVGLRATSLLHSALLPGLRPLHFTEAGVPAEPLEWSAVSAAVDPLVSRAELPPEVAGVLKGKGRACLVLLSSLPDLGKATAAEEERLAARLVRAAQDGGAAALLLAPDPSAAATAVARVQALALEAGLRVAALPSWWPAELSHALTTPRLTVGVASPALFSVQRLWGARVRSVATGRLLPRLKSAEDPVRITLAIVDATLHRGVPAPADELADVTADADAATNAAQTPSPSPSPGDQAGPARLQSILDAVAYSVAPKLLASLRDRSARTVVREPALRDAYISRKRVKKLHLLDRATPTVSVLTGATRGGQVR